MYFAKLLVQVQIKFLELVFGMFKNELLLELPLWHYIAIGGVELLCAEISKNLMHCQND